MKYPLPQLCCLLLGLATALPAQNEGDKPKTGDKPVKATKVETNAPQKDDATTAKDAAIKAIDKFIDQKNVDKKSSTWRTTLSAPPQQSFDAASDYFWHVETSVGALKVQLFPDSAPNHVTCGIYLARLGYYDGLKFHRIIPSFMAQGGCPLGTGSGGPGYSIDGEFVGGPKHDRPGMLSTANTGQPRTDGSQFFLTFVPTPHLDGKHTIWGAVVDGMDTVRALEATGTAGGRPTSAPSIVRAWVTVAPKAKAKEAEKPKDGDGGKKEGDKKDGEKHGK